MSTELTDEQVARHQTRKVFDAEAWDGADKLPGNKYGTGAGGMEMGLRVLSYLMSGLIFYGVLGWLADRWLETSIFLPVGIVLGLGLGVYIVIAKFGRATGQQESDR